MQHHCEDFYDGNYDSGCCLECSNSHPGCLCYDCNCKKCFWYAPPEEGDGENGHCDMVEELKERNRLKTIERYRKAALVEFIKSQKLEKENQRIKKIVGEKKEINYYACQNCKRELATLQEYKIIIKKDPICKICTEEIILTKEDLNVIKN